MATYTTEIASDKLISDNPIHQRLLKAYIAAKPWISGNLLEIGCGEGRGVEELWPHAAQYLGLDKIGEVIQTLQQKDPGVEFKQAVIPPFEGIADNTYDTIVSFQVIEHALEDYKRDLGSFDARIQMRFSFPVKVGSLRSGLTGWQYYDIALELVDTAGVRKQIIHLDFVYSSTCPCSLELSEHARRTRGQLATPHSQRSVARISVEVVGNGVLWFEDLIEIARAAVPTETQVMVKREDEQAFAELNAANPIFVEDAARSFCKVLLADPRIGDFRIVASHQESLHSHDAVSVLTEGPTFAAESLDPRLFASLFHVG